ncbi:MAG: aminotransferase class I/II-fold pyridoxal phosphate-dependent enzyme [Acetatifactor sp.]|nr:aminotransferase class I/II-fold pyridoxal phosphate-dependent enzyme [Acetatifactor sp.]
MLKHGGDRMGFLEEYGREPLDFSVNVNPLGMSPMAAMAASEALALGALYPDIHYRRLRQSVGRHYGIPAEFVIPGNGASDLIWRIAAIKRGQRVLLTAPTFSEYEGALSAFGCKVSYHILTRENNFALTGDVLEKITPELDMFLLCNPNNPTGKTVEQGLLMKILARCRECDVLLWVDECFSGFLDNPQEQLSSYDNLIILQAATKLYAMAGLRLGYAFCAHQKLRDQLWTFGQSWPVSVAAQEAGIAALEDTEYLTRSLSLVSRERERVKKALESVFIEVIGGEANYLFFHTDIPSFQEQLAEKGFLIRGCDSYLGLGDGYYRISLRMPEDNDKLIRAVETLCGA